MGIEVDGDLPGRPSQDQEDTTVNRSRALAPVVAALAFGAAVLFLRYACGPSGEVGNELPEGNGERATRRPAGRAARDFETPTRGAVESGPRLESRPTDIQAFGSLIIRVVTAEARLPIPGERISVGRDPAARQYGPVVDLRADEDGRAVVDRVEPGSYEIVTFRGGTWKGAVAAGAEATKVEIVVPGLVGGTVRVVDEVGRPVAGAAILLTIDQNRATSVEVGVSDESGTAVVPTLALGRAVCASKAGYLRSDFEIVERVAGVIGEIRLVLRVGAVTLHGRVTDLGGSPVSGAAVLYGRRSMANTSDKSGKHRRLPGCSETITNADGNYVLADLSPSNHSSDPSSRILSVEHPRFSVFKHRVEVLKDTAFDVVMLEGGRVVGVVLDEERRPLAMRVHVDDFDGHLDRFPSVTASSPVDGSFALTNVGPGSRTIRALDYRVEGSAVVNVTEGGEVRCEIIVSKGTTISGRVIGAKRGKVKVSAYDQSNGAVYEWNHADDAGNFEISKCRDGASYVLVVRDERGAVIGLKNSVIGGARDVLVDLDIDTGARIEGRIIEGAARVESRIVYACSSTVPAARPIESALSADGTYRFGPLAVGTYSIYCHVPFEPGSRRWITKDLGTVEIGAMDRLKELRSRLSEP